MRRRTVKFAPVDLEPHLNNVGSTSAENLARGELNVWRNSLPAAELPRRGARTTVEGVPFTFAARSPSDVDNVRCDGQLVAVPCARYDWLYVVGAAERRVEDDLLLHYDNGRVDPERLRLSDFWCAPPHFDETEVVATTCMHYPHHVQERVHGKLWLQRVPVTRRRPLVRVRLPRNVAIHLYAATLAAPAAAAAP